MNKELEKGSKKIYPNCDYNTITPQQKAVKQLLEDSMVTSTAKVNYSRRGANAKYKETVPGDLCMFLSAEKILMISNLKRSQ